MDGYEEVKNPIKVREGDFLIIGKDSGLLGLSAKTYSRLGLSNGSYRSENNWQVVKWYLVEHVFDPLIMYVSRVTTVETESAAPEGAASLANDDDFDPNPDAECVGLDPLNTGLDESFGYRSVRENPKWALQTSCIRDAVNAELRALGLPISAITDRFRDEGRRVHDAVNTLHRGERALPHVPAAELYGTSKTEYDRSVQGGRFTPGLVESCFFDGYFPERWCDASFTVSGKFMANAVARGARLLRPKGGDGIVTPMARMIVMRMMADYAEAARTLAVEMEGQGCLLKEHAAAMGRRAVCFSEKTAAMAAAKEGMRAAMDDLGKAMN